LRDADAIVMREMERHNFLNQFGNLCCIASCQNGRGDGDERTYENVIALRVVGIQDGMTADWSRLPYRILEASF